MCKAIVRIDDLAFVAPGFVKDSATEEVVWAKIFQGREGDLIARVDEPGSKRHNMIVFPEHEAFTSEGYARLALQRVVPNRVGEGETGRADVAELHEHRWDRHSWAADALPSTTERRPVFGVKDRQAAARAHARHCSAIKRRCIERDNARRQKVIEHQTRTRHSATMADWAEIV